MENYTGREKGKKQRDRCRKRQAIKGAPNTYSEEFDLILQSDPE